MLNDSFKPVDSNRNTTDNLNQTQMFTKNVSMPHDFHAPPNYSSYQSDFISNSMSNNYLRSGPNPEELRFVLTPLPRTQLRADVSQTTKLKHRLFLILYAFLYLLWCITSIGVHIIFLNQTSRFFYQGFWIGACFLAAAIGLFIVAIRKFIPWFFLIRFFASGLLICIIWLLISIINVVSCFDCAHDNLYYTGGYQTRETYRWIILIIASLATIQTVIGIIIVHLCNKRSAYIQTIYTMSNR